MFFLDVYSVNGSNMYSVKEIIMVAQNTSVSLFDEEVKKHINKIYAEEEKIAQEAYRLHEGSELGLVFITPYLWFGTTPRAIACLWPQEGP
jgi:hypothetical protein